MSALGNRQRVHVSEIAGDRDAGSKLEGASPIDRSDVEVWRAPSHRILQGTLDSNCRHVILVVQFVLQDLKEIVVTDPRVIDHASAKNSCVCNDVVVLLEIVNRSHVGETLVAVIGSCKRGEEVGIVIIGGTHKDNVLV